MDQRTCKGQQSRTLAGQVDSPSSIPASSSGNCRSRKPFGQLVSCFFFYLKPTLRGCWQWGRRRGGAPTDLLLLLESRRWRCAPYIKTYIYNIYDTVSDVVESALVPAKFWRLTVWTNIGSRNFIWSLRCIAFRICKACYRQKSTVSPGKFFLSKNNP